MVPESQAQGREERGGWALRLWLAAAISTAVLSSCFIASCVVIHKFTRDQTALHQRLRDLHNHSSLTCAREESRVSGKAWRCCPKNWHSFGSHCYFMSGDAKTWEESRKACSRMQAHLLVVNSKDEQDFITKHLDKEFSYYLGLWDPQGQNDWQWVDGTPYNLSATFWRRGEPSDMEEACVGMNAPEYYSRIWAWNDIRCSKRLRSVCEMVAVYF
ncbi:C-type lectin domain family 6 member A-like [Thomomys bottae]